MSNLNPQQFLERDVTLPVSALRPSPHVANELRSKPDFYRPYNDSLRDSLKEHGIQQRVDVGYGRTGAKRAPSLEIYDGNHRVYNAKRAGIREIPSTVGYHHTQEPDWHALGATQIGPARPRGA